MKNLTSQSLSLPFELWLEENKFTVKVPIPNHMFSWENTGIHINTHTMCILKWSLRQACKRKSSLIPFTKICGFHQIIDRFSQPCTTVGKTQLLSVYLQLLLADKNGFTTLQHVRSDRIYPSPVCLHPYFQMWHLSLILIFLIEVMQVIFKERLFRYNFLSLLNV